MNSNDSIIQLVTIPNWKPTIFCLFQSSWMPHTQAKELNTLCLRFQGTSYLISWSLNTHTHTLTAFKSLLKPFLHAEEKATFWIKEKAGVEKKGESLHLPSLLCCHGGATWTTHGPLPPTASALALKGIMLTQHPLSYSNIFWVPLAHPRQAGNFTVQYTWPASCSLEWPRMDILRPKLFYYSFIWCWDGTQGLQHIKHTLPLSSTPA
jgi:hypothetical protein